MKACDPEGPLVLHVSKLYHTTDAQSFRAFGRVMSGTVKKGMEVKVLGEGYSPEDEEDMMKVVVEDIWISEARLVLLRVLREPVDLMQFDVGTSYRLTKSLPATWFYWEAWIHR
jgi:translation elongation factor EF-G